MGPLRAAIKLNALKPMLRAERSFYSGHNHVIMGPATVRIPLWKKTTLMGSFVVGIFTYPLYVTYMMFEWDMMDHNY